MSTGGDTSDGAVPMDRLKETVEELVLKTLEGARAQSTSESAGGGKWGYRGVASRVSPVSPRMTGDARRGTFPNKNSNGAGL